MQFITRFATQATQLVSQFTRWHTRRCASHSRLIAWELCSIALLVGATVCMSSACTDDRGIAPTTAKTAVTITPIRHDTQTQNPPQILGDLCDDRDTLPDPRCTALKVSATPVYTRSDSAVTGPLTIHFSLPVHYVSLSVTEVTMSDCVDDRSVPTRCVNASPTNKGRWRAVDSSGTTLFDEPIQTGWNEFTSGPNGFVTVTYTPPTGMLYRYEHEWLLLRFAPAPSTTLAFDSVRAFGPNTGGSFTTTPRERTIRLIAALSPTQAQHEATVTWDIISDPAQRAVARPPATMPKGAQTQFVVPDHPTSRWQHFTTKHGQLDEKALSYQIRAKASWNGQTAESPPVRVRQSELDALRQEYVDFNVPMPPVDRAHRLTDGSMPAPIFTRLNQGDYGIAYIETTLGQLLTQLERRLGPLKVASGFRNPVHHRFHLTRAPGDHIALLNSHQQGNAVDLSVSHSKSRWNRIRIEAMPLGFCTEPPQQNALRHIHLDWRDDPSSCLSHW